MILDRLTARQREVLRRLCRGDRMDAIAAADGISPGTVASMRGEIITRAPKGMDLRAICVAAAEDDPEITVSPTLGERTSSRRVTSRDPD